MKRKIILCSSLLLTGLSLFSCSPSVTYRFNDRGADYAYIYRNGDVAYLNPSSTIEECAISLTKESFGRLLDRKEDFMFIHYSATCSTCAKLEPIFADYIKQSYAHAFYYTGSHNDLINYLGSGAYTGSLISTLRENGSTPAIFFVNYVEGKYNATEADELSTHMGSSTILGDYLYPLYSTTNIYTYTNYEAFKSRVKEDELTAIMDLSEEGQAYLWSDSLKDLAATNSKVLNLLNYSALNEDEKESVTTDYSLQFNDGILQPYFAYSENEITGTTGIWDFFSKYYEG